MISNEKEFWTVGYSAWGRWQVRKASVNDPYNYTLIEDLGPSLKAAYLEADGNFSYHAGRPNISLDTEGYPWLFVITTSGKLYVKRVAADLSTAVLLDTDVEQASVCRGWKSDQYSVDAGLIVAYRKQVGVYLRAYYPIGGVYAWDSVQTISSSSANHVEIKRLNDYRLGIVVDNQLLLSERYYIGGTAKSEFLNIDIDDDFRVLSMTQPEGPHDDISITNVELKNQIEFWVTANYPFYSKDNRWNDISITTSVSSGQGIDSYRIEDGLLKIRMLQAITSPLAYMSFRIRKINRIRFERTAQSRPVCPQLDIIYEAPPVLLEEHFGISLQSSVTMLFKPPTALTNNLEEHFNLDVAQQLSMSIKKLGELSGAFEESFAIDVTSQLSALVFEQVGDTPI